MDLKISLSQITKIRKQDIIFNDLLLHQQQHLFEESKIANG